MGIFFGYPFAIIPNHHRPCAILLSGNNAFKFVIVNRMILNMDSKTFICGVIDWPTRHRPAFHYTIQFKPKIVMQAARTMFLNNENQMGIISLSSFAFWFASNAEIAFLMIF